MSEKNFGKFVEAYTVKKVEDEKKEEYLDIGKFIEDCGVDAEDLPSVPSIDYLSPALKTETMWSLYHEVQGVVWPLPREAKNLEIEGGRNIEVESRADKIKSDKRLTIKVALLRQLWDEEETRVLFQKEYARHLDEDGGINGNYEKYEHARTEINRLEEEIDNLAIELFQARGAEVSEIDSILYETQKNNLKQEYQVLSRLLKENPELAATAAYADLVDYQRQCYSRW